MTSDVPNVPADQGAREARYAEAIDEAVLSARLRAVMAVADAEQAELRAEVERLTEDRDIFRDKAHGFIAANRAYDERLGALVSGLQRAIVRAERLPECVVVTDHLRFLLGDDEPKAGGSGE